MKSSAESDGDTFSGLRIPPMTTAGKACRHGQGSQIPRKRRANLIPPLTTSHHVSPLNCDMSFPRPPRSPLDCGTVSVLVWRRWRSYRGLVGSWCVLGLIFVPSIAQTRSCSLLAGSISITSLRFLFPCQQHRLSIATNIFLINFFKFRFHFHFHFHFPDK